MEVCLSKAVVSESDSIQRKISLDPSAVNLKHFQAAWVLLEAVDMSAPRPLLRGHGWVGWGPCHQGGCTGQVGSELEYAVGPGWSCGRHPKGQEGRDATRTSEGPWVSLLSRISDAKNSTKEKTQKLCTVTSKTS